MSLLLKWKLNSSNPDKRIAAITELAHSGDPHAATLIAQALVRAIDLAKAVSKRPASSKGDSVKDIIDNANVQRAAAAALGELRNSASVETLLRALDEGSEAYVRLEATTALGRIKDKRAVAPLLTMLSKWQYDWGLLAGAAAALGDLGDAAAVGPLQSLLQRAQERYKYLQEREKDASWSPGARQMWEGDLAEVSAALKEIPQALQKLPKTAPLQTVRGSAGMSAARSAPSESQKGIPQIGVSPPGHAWAFLPDAKSVVFQDSQKRLVILDFETGTKREEIEAKDGSSGNQAWDGLTVSSNGKFVATWDIWSRKGWGATIQLWDIGSKKNLSTAMIESQNGKLIEVVFVPGSSTAIALCEGDTRKSPSEGAQARIFSVPSLTWERNLIGIAAYPARYGQGMAVSPDGKLVALGHRLFEIRTGSLIGSLEYDRGSASGKVHDSEGVAFLGDGSRIITGEGDGTARVWDVATQRLLSTFVYGPGSVAVATNAAGSEIATSVVAHSEIKLWNVTGGREPQIFKHKGGVSGVVFSPDGRIIATKWGSRLGCAWEVKSGRILAEYEFPSGCDCRMRFSPDGRFMAVTNQTHSGAPVEVKFVDVARLVQ